MELLPDGRRIIKAMVLPPLASGSVSAVEHLPALRSTLSPHERETDGSRVEMCVAVAE